MSARLFLISAPAEALALGLVLAGCSQSAASRPVDTPPAIEVEPFPDVPPVAAHPRSESQGSFPEPHLKEIPPPVPEAPEEGGAPALSAEMILTTLRREPERLFRDIQGLSDAVLPDPPARLAREALLAGLANILGETTESYEKTLAIERELRPFCPLVLRNLCLTTDAPARYGNPTRIEMEKCVFKPGDVLNVYYEIDRLSQKPEGERFTSRSDADLRIETASGVPVWEFEQWEKAENLRDRTQTSDRYATDSYFHYRGLGLPRQTAPGRYRLVIEFTDLGGVTPRRATASVSFEVAS